MTSYTSIILLQWKNSPKEDFVSKGVCYCYSENKDIQIQFQTFTIVDV